MLFCRPHAPPSAETVSGPKPKPETLPADAALHRPAAAGARRQRSLPQLTGCQTEAPSRPPPWGPSLCGGRIWRTRWSPAGAPGLGAARGQRRRWRKQTRRPGGRKRRSGGTWQGSAQAPTVCAVNNGRERTKRLLVGGTEMSPREGDPGGRRGRARLAGKLLRRWRMRDPCRPIRAARVQVCMAAPTEHTSARGWMLLEGAAPVTSSLRNRIVNKNSLLAGLQNIETSLRLDPDKEQWGDRAEVTRGRA